MSKNNNEQVRFDLRLQSTNGKDVHREFKGSLFLSDGTIAIAEIKPLAKISIQMLHPKDHYVNPDNNSLYTSADVYMGSILKIGGNTFVVIKVEGQSEEMLKTVTIKTNDAPIDSETQQKLNKIQEQIREKIKSRGASTIQGLGRHFRILDDNSDNGISDREFSKALREYGFNISEQDASLLLQLYDKNKDGKIDYEEFLRAVRGDVNEFRKALIRKAFKKLDANKNGVIQLDDIKLFYSAKLNPEVTSGKKTEDQVLLEFLGSFDTIEKDGTVTYEEFEEYYNTISVSIDNDEYFQLMMHNTWKIQ